MNMRFFFVFCLCCLLSSCTHRGEREAIMSMVQEWQGKEIRFPKNVDYTIKATDTVHISSYNHYKIVTYTDSAGCVACRMQLAIWADLATEIDSLTNCRVPILKYVCPRNITDLKYDLFRANYSYPVCIDVNDDFNKLNHFPDDDRFHCFLLDENNRVVLIGNPVQNPKIKDLYIRTICERLGIENVSKTDDNPRVNLGTFSKGEPKTAQFIIKNTDADYLKIDSVYTSCECTAAAINKTEINKNESALLTVTYTPDGAGEFYREVYVKINGEDKPRVFAIEGKTE